MFRTFLSVFIALCVVAVHCSAAPPRVVSCSPEFGEAAVDPGISELRIVFDQDMNTGGMSICGGGPSVPKITGKPRWESPRILVVPIVLEPAHAYQFSINCPSARNFRSATGEPAEITPIQFTTAATPAEARAEALTHEENHRALEALRGAINDRYSHRDLRAVDWEAQLAAHAPALESAQTRGQFARELARLLAPARDMHLSVIIENTTARLGTFSPFQDPNCNPRVLASLVPGWRVHNDTITTGLFEGSEGVGPVLYILISSWPGDAAQVQPALDFLAQHASSAAAPAAAVIIDVRPNGGGDELTARRVAGCFVDKPATYARNKYRDAASPDGWTGLIDRVIEPSRGGPRFTGPVAVLIGPACASSNESFIKMMKTSPRTILIGEPTYGSSGNPKPVSLGNGVAVGIPTWVDHLADGTPLEGRGILPDIGIRVRPDELESADPILEAALRAVRTRK